MKKIVYSIFIAAALVANVSCDNNFEEINVSPNQSPVTDPNLLLTTTIVNTQNILYSTFTGGDMGLCWAQQWSKIQYNDEELYIPRRDQMSGIFDNFYATVLVEANEAYILAGESNNSNLQGAALVMKANAFQILTDLYGPVPFTEALDVTNTQPKYDSQEVVYDGIIGMLNQADALFASGTGTIKPTADKIYGGDVSKWRKFAKSLKLKALMRVSGAGKRATAGAEIAALVSSGGLMSSNVDSAQLVYTASQPDANPIYESIIFGNRVEYRVSSVLVAALNATSDPRLKVFAKPNSANAYVGNIPGQSGSTTGISLPGTFYTNAQLPGVFLSYAQVELLLAEATLKGFIAGDLNDARGHYFDGIKANLAFNNVSFVDTTTFLANPALDFGSVTAGLQKIGEQSWLALYGQGIEAWTEWRRTGYPALTPISTGAISHIPYRFFYSTDENNVNQASYQAAVASLSNGDTMSSKVWWMN